MKTKEELLASLDLDENSPAVFIGDNPADYADAIIGKDIIVERVVYDYDQLVLAFMKHDEMSYEEAVEWIEYNTIRSLPYMGPNAPLVIARQPE